MTSEIFIKINAKSDAGYSRSALYLTKFDIDVFCNTMKLVKNER